MAPKVARGGDGDADIAASPTSAKSTAMRMRGRVVLQGLILLHLMTASLASIDEFMTCDRILEKKRESRLLDEIPCDMSAKSYCEHKGNGYPEAQIWRFKEENRALMRRLYGDLESNSVYREMRASNMASAAASAKAEAKAAKAKAASAKAEGDNNFPLDHDLFSSLEYNIRLGSGLATVQGSREQVVGGSEASKRRPPTKKKVKLIKKKRLKKKPSTEGSDGGGESTTAEGGSEADHPPEDPQPSGSTAQSQVPGFTQLLAGVDLDSLENIESQEASAEPIAQIGSAAAQVSGAGSGDDMDEYEYEEVLEEVDVEVDGAEDDIGGDADEGYGEGDIYTGASVNACPVKEEVFAPYWANNTRDQVLALLNLYPFEQYIHMETCKFPKEEMMCREGCRCEQQYRLHRLLAFDPSNECRGIFSDWFRFPSYCICKCYNVVEETFLFNKDRARAEKSLPGQTRKKAAAEVASGEHRNIPADFTQPRNIPAILPYEVKEALLRDMREDTTKPQKEEEGQSQAASSSSTSTPKPPAVSDNVVDVTEEEAKKSDHFFYGNAPVLEYRPTDGTSGRKTPR